KKERSTPRRRAPLCETLGDLEAGLVAPCPGHRLPDRLSQDVHDLLYLFRRRNERRRQQVVVGEVARDQSLLLRRGDQARTDVELDREGLHLLLVLDDLDAGDKALASHVTHAVLVQERAQTGVQVLA